MKHTLLYPEIPSSRDIKPPIEDTRRVLVNSLFRTPGVVARLPNKA